MNRDNRDILKDICERVSGSLDNIATEISDMEDCISELEELKDSIEDAFWDMSEGMQAIHEEHKDNDVDLIDSVIDKVQEAIDASEQVSAAGEEALELAKPPKRIRKK